MKWKGRCLHKRTRSTAEYDARISLRPEPSGEVHVRQLEQRAYSHQSSLRFMHPPVNGISSSWKWT